ncbi:MAG: MraY family glycosyltransferase [Elusimicrobiaceae bacterium]|nr:MraY family glycosyltransferase [Elusimicrobiota bacterium]
MQSLRLYLLDFICAALITAFSLPIVRKASAKILKDEPTEVKNHKGVVSTAGGTALALGFFASLAGVRFLTDFPSGTLRNLRGIFIGGAIIYLLGLADDVKKPRGLSPILRLIIQACAAAALIHYGIYIQFTPQPFGIILTVLWVVGLTNAFNLIDIMDGLAATQAVLAALAFAVISLPSEYIYVNFAACALLGAAIGFLPYNHSKKLKTFLGDSGSTLLGFLLAAVSLGTSYSAHNPLAVYVPLLILAVPVFNTAFVSVIRISKGISPLTATPDHFPLRLKTLGLSTAAVVLISALAAIIFDAAALYITVSGAYSSLLIYAFSALILGAAAFFLARIKNAS